ncbi:beta-lactamase [Pedobacter duraquae]|uniref:Beta-lactamase n=2 Tax=Pedobacter duraquae TaxID=425511 RepID=A0A4R6IEN7_9SPHI|nr:beta-lactamase [Pedobacter duraquae]
MVNNITIMTRPFTISLFFICLSTATLGYAQNRRNLKQLDTLLAKAYDLGVFKGNLLVAEKGKIIYQKTIGWTDATEQTRLTADYRLHIGSIAKEFNAVAIMILKEQGKLSLDDHVAKYLPELPGWAERIKIRNLLQYTSGVPQSVWRNTKGDADNLNNLKVVTTLDFEPGTKYAYNNNDVFLQRRIIERISGMSYESFVQEKMFIPCGITHAVFNPGETVELVAKSYNDQKKQDNMTYEIAGWPALNLLEFYKWSEVLNSFRLISPAATRELCIAFSGDNQTGLGHGTMEGNKLVKHSHDGTAKNYQALLTSDAAKGITVILMTNNKQNNLGTINRSVFSILAGKPYANLKRSFINDFQAQFENLTGQQTIALYNQTKSDFSDKYAFAEEGTLNEVGYYFLNKKKVADAISVFTLNTRLFPNSGNMYDSLGEAYYVQGDKSKALENYVIALKLDPTLDSAKKMVAELKKI